MDGNLNEICLIELWKFSSLQKELNLSTKAEIQNPESSFEFNELKQQYEVALSNLPEKQRIVFLMSRMENLTYKEIAELLDTNEGAIKVRMFRIMKELKELYKRYEQEDE